MVVLSDLSSRYESYFELFLLTKSAASENYLRCLENLASFRDNKKYRDDLLDAVHCITNLTNIEETSFQTPFLC